MVSEEFHYGFDCLSNGIFGQTLQEDECYRTDSTGHFLRYTRHEGFAIMCGALASRSLGIELPYMLLLAAIVGNPYQWSIGSNTVEVSPTLRGSDGSYEVRFTIK